MSVYREPSPPPVEPTTDAPTDWVRRATGAWLTTHLALAYVGLWVWAGLDVGFYLPWLVLGTVHAMSVVGAWMVYSQKRGWA